MNRTVYAVLNRMLDLLPPFGAALDWRGALAKRTLGKAGDRLRMSAFVTFYDPAKIRLGHHVYIGLGAYFGGGHVELEDEVMIGPYCVLASGNHSARNGSYRYGPYEDGTIRIGRGTWLGAHVTITANVRIGCGCLIAAGSVVTEDVEDYSVVGGVPARLIRKETPREQGSPS